MINLMFDGNRECEYFKEGFCRFYNKGAEVLEIKTEEALNPSLDIKKCV